MTLKSVALCCVVAAGVATAQPVEAPPSPDAGAPSLAIEVEELKRRLAVLGEELESQRTGSAPVTPSLDAARRTGVGPAASKVYGRDGLSIGGYGELRFAAFRQHLQDGTASPQDALADTQRAVLYVGYKFNDWVVLNTEFEFEHGGISDKNPKGEAVVEFAYLDFLVRPWLNVRAGQVLLPVGFLNELHEPPVYLGALRPRLEQSSGLIPSTWHELGAGLYGDLPAGLSYRLFLVNGLNAERFNADGNGAIGGGRQAAHLAIANKPAITGRLDWHANPGLLVGGSVYAGDSAQVRAWPSIWTVLLEAHAEYRAAGFQARAVYAHVSNSRAGLASLATLSTPAVQALGAGAEQQGAYVEAGYDVFTRLPALRQRLTPFARLEWMDTQWRVANGATANPANERTVVTVGLDYKPMAQVAVKLDYDFVFNAAGTGRSQLNLALGYLF